MIEIRNSETLQRWLLESGHLGRLWDRPRFLFDRTEFEREVAGVREQYPQFSTGQAEARAALRLLGKEEGRSRALIVGRRRSWTRRERMFLAAVILLVAVLALLLVAPRSHAQDLPLAVRYRSRLVPGHWPAYEDAQGGQPGGVIWYWQNGGSTLHTFAGGVGYVNCSTNITCSYAGNPPTITITGSGGSGSGCIPPGTTANALLFDAGSGACSDASELTYASNTLTGASGLTVDFSAASALKLSGANTSGLPGTTGQLLYNNGGNLGAEDPVVSGPDARGAAQSKNPVAGLGGIDYGTGCSGGPCVQEAKVDSSGNVYVAVTNSPTVSVSGTVPVSGTFWQATQPVSGTFWQTTQPVSAASLPLPSGASIAADQCGASTGALCYVQPSDGTHSMPMGDASARTIHVTADNSSIAVTGTFWQTTQPVSWSGQSVSLTGSWPYSGTLGAVTQASGPWTVNQTQIGGTTLAAADPCQANTRMSLSINEATSTTTQIIAGSSGKHNYICSAFFISATAQNINLLTGTGTNCATVHAGLFGGTTAATGPNLGANTGWTLGNGEHFVTGGQDTAGDEVCYASSSTGQVSGVITYVQQ